MLKTFPKIIIKYTLNIIKYLIYFIKPEPCVAMLITGANKLDQATLSEPCMCVYHDRALCYSIHKLHHTP